MTLPWRRETRTIQVEWPLDSGMLYNISLGYQPETRVVEEEGINYQVPSLGPVQEIWSISGAKVGSDTWAVLQDMAHAMSKELQAGVSPEKIAGRVMRGKKGEPLSLYGILADCLAR